MQFVAMQDQKLRCVLTVCMWDSRLPSCLEVYGGHVDRQLSDFVGAVFGGNAIFRDPTHQRGFLHRLDVPSSGLVLVAKSFEAFYDLQDGPSFVLGKPCHVILSPLLMLQMPVVSHLVLHGLRHPPPNLVYGPCKLSAIVVDSSGRLGQVQLHAGQMRRDYTVLCHGLLRNRSIVARLRPEEDGPSLCGRGKPSISKLAPWALWQLFVLDARYFLDVIVSGNIACSHLFLTEEEERARRQPLLCWPRGGFVETPAARAWLPEPSTPVHRHGPETPDPQSPGPCGPPYCAGQAVPSTQKYSYLWILKLMVLNMLLRSHQPAFLSWGGEMFRWKPEPHPCCPESCG